MLDSYCSPSSCSREDLFSAQGVRVHSIKQIFESYQGFSIHQATCNCCHILALNTLQLEMDAKGITKTPPFSKDHCSEHKAIVICKYKKKAMNFWLKRFTLIINIKVRSKGVDEANNTTSLEGSCFLLETKRSHNEVWRMKSEELQLNTISSEVSTVSSSPLCMLPLSLARKPFSPLLLWQVCIHS